MESSFWDIHGEENASALWCPLNIFCYVKVLCHFYLDREREREFSKMIKNTTSGIRSICIQFVFCFLPTLGLRSSHYTELDWFFNRQLMKNWRTCRRFLAKSQNAFHIHSVGPSICCRWFVWSSHRLVFGVGVMEKLSTLPTLPLLL